MMATAFYRKEDTGRDLTVVTEKSPYEYAASPETILAHLARVSAIMPIKGIDKHTPDEGSRQTTIFLNDYLRRLVDKGVTEVDLVIALEWFVENGKSDFFPSFSKLNQRLFGREKDQEVD